MRTYILILLFFTIAYNPTVVISTRRHAGLRATLQVQRFDNCDLSKYDCKWGPFESKGGHQNEGVAFCTREEGGTGHPVYVAKRASQIKTALDAKAIKNAYQLAHSRHIPNLLHVDQICTREERWYTTIMPYVKVHQLGAKLSLKCISELLQGAFDLYKINYTYTDFKTENTATTPADGACLLTDVESICDVDQQCPNINLYTLRYTTRAKNKREERRATMWLIIDNYVNDICNVDFLQGNELVFRKAITDCITTLASKPSIEGRAGYAELEDFGLLPSPPNAITYKPKEWPPKPSGALDQSLSIAKGNILPKQKIFTTT